MITEFTVGAGHTINLGNFESIRIEATITVAVDPEQQLSDEQWTEVKATAQAELRKLLEETYRAQSRQDTDRNRAAQRARSGIFSDPSERPTK